MRAFQDHFSSVAKGYAANRPSYPAELIEYLASLAPSRELAVEAGCGSGQFTEPLSKAFTRVIATDASAEQLAGAPKLPNVAYHQARAETLPVEAHSADFVAVAQAVHWFDLPLFYEEVKRIAKPGALFALVAYTTCLIEGEPGRVFANYYSNTLDGYWPAERAIVDNHYRDLAFPFPEIEAKKFTIHTEWELERLIGYARTWSGTKALIKAGRQDTLDAFERELAMAWGDPKTKRAIDWPVVLRLGRL